MENQNKISVGEAGPKTVPLPSLQSQYERYEAALSNLCSNPYFQLIGIGNREVWEDVPGDPPATPPLREGASEK